jgi:hypothetical protein
MPGTGFKSSSVLEVAQETVCMLSCSAQRLGPMDNVDTLAMRNHCRRLCDLSGIESSRLCLSYCRSFPEDPSCPSADAIAAVQNRTIAPTPAPTTPAYVPPPLPLLANSSGTPVLAIKQLAMGYNAFLGLRPHEQLGIYIRNESEYALCACLHVFLPY